jgi:hypothetical protein
MGVMGPERTAPKGKAAAAAAAAAKAAPALVKRSSAEQVFMDTAKQPARKAARRDFEGAVEKAVHDNFKGWDAADIHGSKDPETGLTLYETIADRKKKHAQDPKAFPMGSRWYKEIRYKFMPDSYPAKRLKAVNPDEPISDDLLKAMMYYKSTGSRAKMDAFINLTPELNQREVCGVYTYLLELKPTTSSDSLKCCLNVMRMVVRLGLDSKFNMETSLLKDAFDDILCQAHLVQKGAVVTPLQFVHMHGEVLALIVPMKSLLKVLGVTDGKFKPVKAELTEVVNAGKIGKRLLGFLCRQTLAEEVSVSIEEALNKFCTPGKTITMETWAFCRKQITDQLHSDPLLVESCIYVGFSVYVCIGVCVHRCRSCWQRRL